jgi:hypothetical protein
MCGKQGPRNLFDRKSLNNHQQGLLKKPMCLICKEKKGKK